MLSSAETAKSTHMSARPQHCGPFRQSEINPGPDGTFPFDPPPDIPSQSYIPLSGDYKAGTTDPFSRSQDEKDDKALTALLDELLSTAVASSELKAATISYLEDIARISAGLDEPGLIVRHMCYSVRVLPPDLVSRL